LNGEDRERKKKKLVKDIPTFMKKSFNYKFTFHHSVEGGMIVSFRYLNANKFIRK